MSDVNVLINKKVRIDDTHIGSIELTLTVTSTEGITKNIFVSIYHPFSNYYGDAYYEFSNVAYYDELFNVPDTLDDNKNVCEIRRPCATASFKSIDEMNDWINTVYSDIQRLILQVKTLDNNINNSEVVITEDTIKETITDNKIEVKIEQDPITYRETAIDTQNTDETEVVTLSFDGR